MRILGVNGIWNPENGERSFTDRMLMGLRISGRHKTVDVHYPLLTTLEAYVPSNLRERAEHILSVYEPGDTVIAHSAGCLLTYTAMRMGARFGKVFFFAAAAESNLEFPKNGMQKLYNIFSPDDPALRLGRLLPFHPFGALGMKGYKGDDHRVVNVPAPGYDHNGYVEPEHLEEWVKFISRHISPTRRKKT